MEMLPSRDKWFSWKSPIGIGFFVLTITIALYMLVNTLVNVLITVQEMHQQTQSAGMSAQELQQLEQAAPATTGAGGAAQ